MTALEVMVRLLAVMMSALEFMVRDVAVMLTAGDTRRVTAVNLEDMVTAVELRSHGDSCSSHVDKSM